ncbi:hypothetical protein COCNU_09G006830 [Cocos nucifera]|uniref:Uncharacterized protein n=1 Tax=Cocos nucifera TaxID=13894 RepID=A0A8K0IKB0_COCNU|nr:hypothetical protein COCNU_09G006830 [Cocos nucifera]
MDGDFVLGGRHGEPTKWRFRVLEFKKREVEDLLRTCRLQQRHAAKRSITVLLRAPFLKSIETEAQVVEKAAEVKKPAERDDFRTSYKEVYLDSKSVSTVAKEGGEKWKSMGDEVREEMEKLNEENEEEGKEEKEESEKEEE